MIWFDLETILKETKLPHLSSIPPFDRETAWSPFRRLTLKNLLSAEGRFSPNDLTKEAQLVSLIKTLPERLTW